LYHPRHLHHPRLEDLFRPPPEAPYHQSHLPPEVSSHQSRPRQEDLFRPWPGVWARRFHPEPKDSFHPEPEDSFHPWLEVLYRQSHLPPEVSSHQSRPRPED